MYPQYSTYAPAYGNTYLPRVEQTQPYAPQAQPVPQMTTMQQPIGLIKGRPVTSEEEARGIPVDFDGSVMVFPDAGHGMIYTKQLNMLDGTATFRRYALVTPQDPVPQMAQAMETPKEYADKQEVAELRQLVTELQMTVDALPKRNGKRKEIDARESLDADSVDV